MDETTPLGGGNGNRSIGGRYTLRGLLGQGGMADVELAHDQQLDRQVAVKILHARYADDPSFLARFRREAQAAASLNHPNIVAVYDTGDYDGRPFIVMEYVAGRSLRDLLRTESVLPGRATEIVGDAALGLHYAHERGLIHRDIKPGNIMVSDEGHVKVADFGIARAVSAESVTQTAAVFGTAAYVAPEQAQGEPVDRRTDVYALGCVLYELLAGRQPFAADSPVALAYKHITETPVPPSELNGEISEDLDAIVMQAMAKDPGDRYQTARDLNADLQRAQAGLPLAAAPVGAWGATTQVIDRDPDRTAVVAPAAGAYTDEDSEAYEYEEEEDDRRRRVGYALLALLLLAILIIAGFLLASLFRQEPVSQIQVPDVRGLDLVEAQNTLEDAGFRSQVAERVTSLEFDEDEVVDTDPEPLSRAAEDTVVALTLSDGPPLTTVPELVGLSRRQARDALRAANLSLGDTTREASDEFDEGQVISSDPEFGEEVPEDSEVALVISSGPDTVALPNVENLPEEDAVDALEGACEPQPCVDVNVEREQDDAVEEGRVISQNPGPNSEVAIGSEVTIVVSEGSGTATVPNVENLPEEEARERLAEACEPEPCFESAVTREFSATVAEGRVISQDPGAGAEEEKGSTVELVVSRGPEPTPEPEPTEPPPTETPTADVTEG